jgi:hypothetical protein
MNQEPSLELRVVETSPRTIAMSVQAITIQRPDSRKRVFQVVYHRGKSFMGIVAGGSEDQTVLQLSVDNIQGVVALVDGGYDGGQQQSPERRLELVTVEKKQKPLTVAEWTLPREKHERPIRIDMITGALKALINE